MVRLANAAPWPALWLLAMRGAAAGVIDSPECRRDPAMADRLIHAVSERGENVGQMDASIGDIRFILSTHRAGR